MYRLKICVALAALLLGSACSPTELLSPQSHAAEGAGEVIPLERLRAEPYSFTYSSGLTDSARIVVRDAQSWSKLWQQIWARHSPLPPLPAVDFSRDMLIVAALGTRSSGGYSIYIDSAYQRADHVEVVVRKVSPGSRCVVTAAFTQPVDIARIPRVNQPVRYQEQSVVHHCE